MARRGTELREHILWSAKDVFLEMGFERASMDVVAARAETSKRSLYAHFESKEKLFLAVIELVRGLFLDHLRSPAELSAKPAEALVLFCGRYLEALLYRQSVRMGRIAMAESERFPEGAALYFDVLFTQVHERLVAYLRATFHRSPRTCDEAAHRLLAQVLYPRLPRALFGVDPLHANIPSETPVPTLDLKPIRKAVAETIDTLQS